MHKCKEKAHTYSVSANNNNNSTHHMNTPTRATDDEAQHSNAAEGYDVVDDCDAGVHVQRRRRWRRRHTEHTRHNNKNNTRQTKLFYSFIIIILHTHTVYNVHNGHHRAKPTITSFAMHDIKQQQQQRMRHTRFRVCFYFFISYLTLARSIYPTYILMRMSSHV